jgi:thiol-disulfide isomerase/thioredoxin
MNKGFFLYAFVVVFGTVQAFTAPKVVGARTFRHSRTAVDAVIDIGSEKAFDKIIKDSGNSLVVVDYSTTWCGPCKGAFKTIKIRKRNIGNSPSEATHELDGNDVFVVDE